MIRTVRGERITAMAQLRPYGMHAFLLAYTVVLLSIDGRFAGRGRRRRSGCSPSPCSPRASCAWRDASGWQR